MEKQIEELKAEVAALRAELASVKAGGGRAGARTLSERALAVKALFAKAKTVRIRVSRLVQGKGKGNKVEAAQPIAFSSRWRRLWTPPTGFPSVLEVGEVYEVPEPLAKALGPDVQLV